MLAARSLNLTGLPSIADGLYERALPYTWIVAQSTALFGDSLAAARLPSVLMMAIAAMALHHWLFVRTDKATAHIATLLFALSPFAVETAQLVRFYAPQLLTFLLAAIAFFESFYAGRRLRIGLLAIAAILLGVATMLQPTTLLGVVGLGIWTAVWTVPVLIGRCRDHGWNIWLLAIMMLVAAILAALAIMFSPVGAWLLHEYLWSPAFNRHNQFDILYYHKWFLLYYPTFWPAIALLALLAIVKKGHIATYCTLIFATVILLASFAGSKNLRYIVFAQPFFFAIVGMAAVLVFDKLTELFRGVPGRFVEQMAIPSRYQRVAAAALGGFCVAFLVLGNPASIRTLALQAELTIPPDKPDVDWQEARPDLVAAFKAADVVVTTADVETLYFLGDFDFFVVPAGFDRRPDQANFSIDFRTGRPVIATPVGMTNLIDCFSSGIVVSNTRRWDDKSMTDPILAKLVSDQATPLDLPAASGVIAFAWSDTGQSSGSHCDAIRELAQPRG